MSNDERLYWLAFSAFSGIGPLRFRLLLDFFGTAKKAWFAKEKELLEAGFGNELVAKFVLYRRRFLLNQVIEKIKKEEIKVITLLDQQYPKNLKEISDAPFVLYARGNLDYLLDKNPKIAVVGTRRITNYGKEVTKKLTQELVENGMIIVSGMAYGVDTVAHESAVEKGGKTIAVLGSGIDIIYPVANTQLYMNIIKKNGVVISEFPPGQRVIKGLFPARNRIISGLSLGVVVVEGACDSGALITARYAAEQGREVFAIPGPITSPMSKAPTILLKQGAKMVTDVGDILEELNLKTQISNLKNIPQVSNLNLSKDETVIIELLKVENLHFDEIVRKSSLDPRKLGSILTIMEMKKIIKNLGGGVWSVNG